MRLTGRPGPNVRGEPFLTGSATVDPDPQNLYDSLTINVPVVGAVRGDLAICNVTNIALPDNVFVVVRDVTTDQVVCELVNLTGSTLDADEITVTVLVMKV